MKLKTTLAIIRKYEPCADGWKKLLKHIGADYADDKTIDFSTILESNGLKDALWALRAVMPEQEKDRDKLSRLFACDCAESVLFLYEKNYPNDNRPRDAIRIAKAFANGEATEKQLADAWADAWDATGDATVDVAWYAAHAAGDVAWYAAHAAGDVAWYAAHAAGYAAGYAQKELFKRYFCSDEEGSK